MSVAADNLGSVNSPVDRDLPEPLPRQVAAVLRREIYDGHLTGRLPSEADLAARFEVTRDPTIRDALAILRDEGLVTVLRGRGWFVVKH